MPDDAPHSAQRATRLQLVAIPAGATADEIMVTASGRMDDVLESVKVATADGLHIETSAKTGFRWVRRGWTTSDPNLEDSASRAVTAALLEQIPQGQPQENARELADSAVREGRRLGDQVLKPTSWTTVPVDVDGETFALFVTEIRDSIAAVADIGPSRILIHGARLPPALTLRLIPVSALQRP